LTRDKPQTHLGNLLSSLVSAGKVRSADVEVISAGIPLKPLPRTYGKRVIAVGDAAGQVKPTTCGGIYYGLICADLAVTMLGEAIVSEDFSARALSQYEKKWRQKLSRELEVDYYARKFFERLSDERINHLFDVIADHGIVDSLMSSEDLSFDWHSTVILRLMGHRVMSHALSVMGMPFRFGSEI
jgi:digeranylgeranylglycerophospholipid reductase